MSELRTQDQILTDVGINVENFKQEKELLYSCIRRAMDEFAEQYHNWKESKANGATTGDGGLHLQNVRLSCYKEVWEIWQTLDDDQAFASWLYNKGHKA